MFTGLLVTFLVAHGFVHMAVWAPAPQADQPAPFVPSHSGLLSAVHVADHTTRALSVVLAAAAAGGFALAGIGVALSASWTSAVAVTAALTGLLLKVVYFNPWLSLAVVLDAAVLSAATAGWPMALS